MNYATSGRVGGWIINPLNSETIETSLNNGALSFGILGTNGSALLSPCGYKVTSTKTAIFGGTESGEHTWVQTIGQNFAVTNDGTLYASGAKISGSISADDGIIAGFKISKNCLSDINGSCCWIYPGYDSRNGYGDSRYPKGLIAVGSAGHGVVQLGKQGNNNGDYDYSGLHVSVDGGTTSWYHDVWIDCTGIFWDGHNILESLGVRLGTNVASLKTALTNRDDWAGGTVIRI